MRWGREQESLTILSVIVPPLPSKEAPVAAINASNSSARMYVGRGERSAR
jgi:hypothetical protein